jgi:hypothetical protein
MRPMLCGTCESIQKKSWRRSTSIQIRSQFANRTALAPGATRVAQDTDNVLSLGRSGCSLLSFKDGTTLGDLGQHEQTTTQVIPVE